MKKLFVLAMVALMGASAANAQLLRSRTFAKSESKSTTTWIVRAGLGLNNFAGGYVSDAKKVWDADKAEAAADGESFKGSFGAKPGYDVSIAFNKTFGASNAYWGMELGFGNRGGKWSEKYEYDGRTEEESGSVLTHTVRLMPIMGGYKYNVTENIAVDAHLGLYASYDMAGKLYNKYEDSKYPEDNYDINFGFGDALDPDYSSSLTFGDMWNRFDIGMQIGVGVWFNRFNLDFSYQRGFMGMYSDDYLNNIGPNAKNACSSNFMIRLGVGF